MEKQGILLALHKEIGIINPSWDMSTVGKVLHKMGIEWNILFMVQLNEVDQYVANFYKPYTSGVIVAKDNFIEAVFIAAIEYIKLKGVPA